MASLTFSANTRRVSSLGPAPAPGGRLAGAAFLAAFLAAVFFFGRASRGASSSDDDDGGGDSSRVFLFFSLDAGVFPTTPPLNGHDTSMLSIASYRFMSSFSSEST